MGAARDISVGSVLRPSLVAPGFGPPVCRLGLASYGRTDLAPGDVLSAVDRGVNFLNWQGLAEGAADGDAFPAAISTLGARRRTVVVCAQFGARTAADAATVLHAALAALGTDYIDVLTLYYVERAGEWEEVTAPDGALGYLRDAQRDGAVRRIGITSHQRALAAAMARSGLLDAVMIRYNAAHHGAERDVFPVTRSLGLPGHRLHRPPRARSRRAARGRGVRGARRARRAGAEARRGFRPGEGWGSPSATPGKPRRVERAWVLHAPRADRPKLLRHPGPKRKTRRGRVAGANHSSGKP